MAELVPIQGSQVPGKVRDPLGVVALSFVTLGIYAIVWYYKINKEMAEIGKGRGTEECGTDPGTSLLAITLGALVIVPALVSIYKSCVRLSAAERVTGTRAGMEAGLLFLLYLLLAPVALYIAQSNLNKVLDHQAGGATVAPGEAPAAG
ncbi:MAG TPA: DUF4234 domain-containing protein [Thermoleophilaceae bacterium]|jgi:hypothetical protein|nr:DUF4234 domain-containing protein [Thermoleophilaceae bacterium]